MTNEHKHFPCRNFQENNVRNVKGQTTAHRDHAIDCIKGFCMLLVIIDHCGLWLCPALDCVEVPAFFIASGFLYNSNITFEKLIRAKVQRLIIPYILYTVAYIVLFRPASSLLYNIALPANEPLWFLKTLVWVFLAAYLLDHISFNTLFRNRTKPYSKYIPLSISIIFAFFASLHHVHILTLIGLQQAIIALPLFYVGNILNRTRILQQRWSLICIAIWLITACSNIHFHNSYIGPNFLLFSISALAGFGALYSLFNYIKHLQPLEYVGKKSLEILGIHSIVIGLLSPLQLPWYLLILTTITLTLFYAYILSLIKRGLATKSKTSK